MTNSSTKQQVSRESDISSETVRPRSHRRGRLFRGETFFQSVPGWLSVLVLAGCVWGCFTTNPLPTVASLLALPLLAGLLWLRGETPVLLFTCCIQWLQATMAIFYCDWQGTTLATDLDVGGTMVEKATWLSLAGVLVLALGMRLALLNRNRQWVRSVHEETRLLQAGRVFMAYLFGFGVSLAIGLVAWIVPGLTQPLLALGTLRWVMVFLLAYCVIVNRRQYGLLGLAVVLELIVGFTGFFSGFKSIFYILLLVLAGGGSLKGWRLFQFATLGILIVLLAIFWTAVKVDYRDFVNQGTGQQIVSVPLKERLEKIAESAETMNPAKFADGFDKLLLRICYVKFFALTLENVPTNVPYEHGNLWLGAIKQVLMPRLLFPNKAALDDSARTVKYTGVDVAGMEASTSIGIGYFGESYIDFGPVGMFAPIFLLGLFCGFVYRFFIKYAQRKVIGLAIAVCILVFGACEIETSNIKIIGGNVMSCLVMVLFLKFGETPLWNLIISPARRLNQRDRGKARKTEGGRLKAENGRGTDAPWSEAQ